MARSLSGRGAAALAAAVVIAGCGGSGHHSKTVSADAYIKSVCQAVTPLRTATNGFSKLKAGSTPEAVKGEMTKVITTLSGDLQRASTGISKAGVPDVSGGARFARALHGAVAKLASESHGWIGEVQALPTADPAKFSTDLQHLGSQLTGLGTALTNSHVSSPAALERAASTDAACRGVIS